MEKELEKELEKEFDASLMYLIGRARNKQNSVEDSAAAMRYAQAIQNLVNARHSYFYTNYMKKKDWNY